MDQTKRMLIQLVDDAWHYGSYPRKTYKYNNLYTCFSYKDFTSFWNLNTGKYTITDKRILAMEASGLIDQHQRAAYDREMQKFTERIAEYDDGPMEDIYGQAQQIRLKCVGEAALKKLQKQHLNSAETAESFYQKGLGIDQRAKKDALIRNCDAVIFAVTQTELAGLMRMDLEQALTDGKQIYILTSKQPGSDIPCRTLWKTYLGECETQITFLEMEDDNLDLNLSGIYTDSEADADHLQHLISERNVCLFVYGEDGLLHCKHLLLDTIVYADVSGFYTKSVTNQLADTRPCVVYIPPYLDITEQVTLLEKTRVSYWQLAQLWRDHGDEIYNCSVETLYRKYPQYFLNIYENGDGCPEAEPGYPIQIGWENSAEKTRNYYRLRDQAIREYLGHSDNMDYISTWFDENMEEREIPWDCKEQQSGILVHGIRMKQAQDSHVISCPPGVGMRQMAAQMTAEKGSETDTKNSLQIFSNFLFFMTPRLAQMYNELRKDRPQEQCEFHRDHLDFKLICKDGKRVETFPLFRKACIAMKKNGQFLFFNFRLGGGRMTVAGRELQWNRADVDAESENKPILLYTPQYSVPDEEQSPVTYQKLVGHDRLNLVIVQDKIVYIRMGEVMLSSVGVVVSLEQSRGETFIKEAGLKSLENGYYDCSNLEFTLKLDKPEELTQEDWDEIAWAYGGGLSLILNGISVCDDGDPEQCFRDEGWMSPLSRQTQEAEIHRMIKHPRTAIGLTKDGSLVILVYSGRILLSSGADYREMIAIARTIFPDIQSLMNVDGGGSAMLGMAVGKSFMELSYPAISLDSCAGMVRPINTALCLRP